MVSNLAFYNGISMVGCRLVGMSIRWYKRVKRTETFLPSQLTIYHCRSMSRSWRTCCRCSGGNMWICSADMPRTCWTSIFSISGVSCPSNITRVKYTNRRKHRKVMLIQTNAFLTRKYRQLLFPNTNRRHLQVLGLPGYHQFLGPFVRATQVIAQGNESRR